MEYSLRQKGLLVHCAYVERVLILILMEYSLRLILLDQYGEEVPS